MKSRQRVSFVIPSHDQRGTHCFGVNSLFLTEHNTLFSAGRDGTIQQWKLYSSAHEHVHSYEHHTDWVNDITVLAPDRMVSCSSDTTLKLWDTNGGELLKTLAKHEDYVKAVVFSPFARTLISGGLDAYIHVWDVENLVNIANIDSRMLYGGSAQPLDFRKGSIYSLACNSQGTVLLSGSTENVIRAWDLRTKAKLGIGKLTGHTDTIRALLLNPDGTLGISGSSDGTIKVWDLRQFQCMHTIYSHQDSVWTLATDATFSRVFSGGKEGNILSTEMSTFQSSAVCTLLSPILKLAYSPNNSLWVATTQPTIENWNIANESTCLQKIPGRSGIVQARILNNRQQILTKDDSNSVALWDVFKAKRCETFGKVDFDSKASELFAPISIPNWFSLDTSNGGLVVHLDFPQCFSAEVYPSDFLSIPEQLKDGDHRINLGELLVKALFSSWKAQRKEEPAPVTNNTSTSKKTEDNNQSKRSQENAETEKAILSEMVPHIPPDVSLFISDTGTELVSFRCLLTEVEAHHKGLTDVLPRWVFECVVEGKITVPKDDPLSFHLVPENEKDISRLPSSKLSGDKFLRISKLTTFVVSKLQLKAPPNDPDFIQILCNGEILSPTSTLLTAKTFFWKSSDEMTLKYRVHPNKLSLIKK